MYYTNFVDSSVITNTHTHTHTHTRIYIYIFIFIGRKPSALSIYSLTLRWKQYDPSHWEALLANTPHHSLQEYWAVPTAEPELSTEYIIIYINLIYIFYFTSVSLTPTALNLWEFSGNFFCCWVYRWPKRNLVKIKLYSV